MIYINEAINLIEYFSIPLYLNRSLVHPSDLSSEHLYSEASLEIKGIS
jgi:hypothetical protein